MKQTERKKKQLQVEETLKSNTELIKRIQVIACMHNIYNAKLFFSPNNKIKMKSENREKKRDLMNRSAKPRNGQVESVGSRVFLVNS